jgi:hypothetical protein
VPDEKGSSIAGALQTVERLSDLAERAAALR